MSSSPVPDDYEFPVADTADAADAADKGYETIQLHQNGNAILVVRESSTSPGKKFTVSSDTLSLASPYFKTMFNSSFKEGVETSGGLCPEIRLEEDDPEAMEILLSLLHFNIQAKYTELEPRMITMVAQKSDKYECNRAMTPWTFKWLGNVGGGLKPETYGLLLAAAYLFDAPEFFRSLSDTAIKNMPPRGLQTWLQDDLISLLPQEIQGERPLLAWICHLGLSHMLTVQIPFFGRLSP